MPKFTKTAEAELEDFEKKVVQDLLTNDRPYSLDEEENEKKAERYSAKEYPRIPPIPGTLAFRFRNIKGGNESIMRFLLVCEDKNRKKFVKDFEILWKNMDAFSKKRVDIFDVLCEKYNVSKKKFWGAIQEGMFDDSEAMVQISLHGQGHELVELIKGMAKLPKNFKDRELYAKMLGLAKDAPFMQYNDNSKHETTNNVQVNNNVPAFASSIRRSEKVIRQEAEPLALGEGKQDYVDAEFSASNDEEEPIKVERKIA